MVIKDIKEIIKELEDFKTFVSKQKVIPEEVRLTRKAYKRILKDTKKGVKK